MFNQINSPQEYAQKSPVLNGQAQYIWPPYTNLFRIRLIWYLMEKFVAKICRQNLSIKMLGKVMFSQVNYRPESAPKINRKAQ
jgi:hypothetical protein